MFFRRRIIRLVHLHRQHIRIRGGCAVHRCHRWVARRRRGEQVCPVWGVDADGRLGEALGRLCSWDECRECRASCRLGAYFDVTLQLPDPVPKHQHAHTPSEAIGTDRRFVVPNRAYLLNHVRIHA